MYRPSRRNVLSQGLAALVTGAVLSLSAAHAAGLPEPGRAVSKTGIGQPIGDFLQGLLADAGVPAQISSRVAGTVHGPFQGRIEKVLSDLGRSYAFVTYFDGSVLHVEPAAERERHVLSLTRAQADQLVQDVNRLGLADPGNTLQALDEGRIVAAGTRRFLAQIQELQRSLQAPADGGRHCRTIALRFAWAQDRRGSLAGQTVVEAGVASKLREALGHGMAPVHVHPVSTRPSVRGPRGEGSTTFVEPPAGLRRAPAGGRDREVEQLVTGLGRAADSRPAEPGPAPSAALAERSDGEPGRSDPAAALPMTITADSAGNQVIVCADAARLAEAVRIIASLDVEAEMVEIEARIIDVRTDRAHELGVSWHAGRGKLSAGFEGAPSAGVGNGLRLGIDAVRGLLARVRALEQEGAARVVSSPQIVTRANKEAVFSDRETVHVPVAGKEDVDLFPISAGTLLRVLPHVSRHTLPAKITMAIRVEDGSFNERQVDRVPGSTSSGLDTEVTIDEGTSLLIGGKVFDATTTAVDGVPVLRRLPFIGKAFESRASTSTRVERIVLITPRLAGSAGSDTAQGSAMKPERLSTQTRPSPAARPIATPPVATVTRVFDLEVERPTSSRTHP